MSQNIYITMRENAVVKLFEPLLNDETVALNVELSVHHYTIRELNIRNLMLKYSENYATVYKDRCRSVYLNMKNCEYFKQYALSATREEFETIERMTHQEMNPDAWKDRILRKEQRDFAKYNEDEQASTDMYECPKCGSRKSTFYTMQIRSADEPETVFVTCLSCKNHYRR